MFRIDRRSMRTRFGTDSSRNSEVAAAGQRGSRPGGGFRRFAAVAVLVIAFLAGRYSPRAGQPQVAGEASAVRERVLLVAVGDHLERSKMLLVELANADPSRKLAIADEREIAQDLVHTNRLYRQTAVSAGDERVVSLLDQLERVLVEIAHSPDELAPAELESLRDQIRDEHLIFKIRVAGSKLAQEETL